MINRYLITFIDDFNNEFLVRRYDIKQLITNTVPIGEFKSTNQIKKSVIRDFKNDPYSWRHSHSGNTKQLVKNNISILYKSEYSDSLEIDDICLAIGKLDSFSPVILKFNKWQRYIIKKLIYKNIIRETELNILKIANKYD